MIEKTAKREGFGARLALGAKKLVEEMGIAEYSVEVKGLEVPYHDPRGAYGVGLVYATSPRGACHNQSHYFLVELGQTRESIGVDMLPRQDYERKPANVARHQDWTSLLNSLVMCILANVPVSDTVNLLNHATGWDYTAEQAILSGERIWNMKRMINHHLGASRQDDRLPEHLLQPLTDGGAAGNVVPLDMMLGKYYAVRGWEPVSGLPTKSTLTRLGLEAYLPSDNIK
jgi:aldehyde:ferredoxin oxidoreductase